MESMKQNEPNVAKTIWKKSIRISFLSIIFTHCIWLSVPPVDVSSAATSGGNGNACRKRGMNTARPSISDTVAL
jgi:hypothetical protein